jgi:hypothetical protein
LPGRAEENREKPVKIAGGPAEILTKHYPKTNPFNPLFTIVHSFNAIWFELLTASLNKQPCITRNMRGINYR